MKKFNLRNLKCQNPNSFFPFQIEKIYNQNERKSKNILTLCLPY